MGIEGLYPFLDEHELVEIISLTQKYRHQIVPCDIASTLFRFRTTSETDDKFMSKVKTFLVSFLMAEIHVVFIFDGKAPKDKAEEHRARAEQRERTEDRLAGLKDLLDDLTLTDLQIREGIVKLNMRIQEIEGAESRAQFDLAERAEEFVQEGNGEIPLIDQVSSTIPEESTVSALRTTLRLVYEKRMTRNVKLEPRHFQMVQSYMTQYGIPWIQAEGEAEAFACYLIEHHQKWFAPALLTEDSDSLTYGVPYWLSKYDSKDGTCRSINLATVIDKLGFKSFEQWRDFCILCECDYNHRLPGYGPAKLYRLWIQAGLSLEDFLMTTATTVTGEQIAAVRMDRCRVLFENFGQDSEELRDQVLGGCFNRWLAKQPRQLPYWDLTRENEFARDAIPDMTGGAWGGGEVDQDGEYEFGRMARCWNWPAMEVKNE